MLFTRDQIIYLFGNDENKIKKHCISLDELKKYSCIIIDYSTLSYSFYKMQLVTINNKKIIENYFNNGGRLEIIDYFAEGYHLNLSKYNIKFNDDIDILEHEYIYNHCGISPDVETPYDNLEAYDVIYNILF